MSSPTLKITLQQLVAACQEPTFYLAALSHQPMAVSAAHDLRRLAKKADEELQLFNESRRALAGQFGHLDEASNLFRFDGPDDDAVAFQAGLEELFKKEIELPYLQIRLSDLGRKAEFSAAGMEALSWLFQQDSDGEEVGEGETP